MHYALIVIKFRTEQVGQNKLAFQIVFIHYVILADVPLAL